MSDINIYTLNMDDKNSLLAAYMPFIKNGGIFLKTAQLDIGSIIGVLINLPDEPQIYTITGKVVWLTQKTSMHEGGIGVQFQDNNESQQLKHKIDSLLVGLDRTKMPTMTA